MSRKSLILTLGIALTVIVVAGLVAVLLVRHEPTFYAQAAIEPGPERRNSSKEFVQKFSGLFGSIMDKRQWNETFTEDQINSYFEEDFLREHETEQPLPARVSAPRVSFDTDRVRLGFRYGSGRLSTVLWLELKVWLVAREPNLVALEFVGTHAGALPISVHSWLERQFEAIRRSDIETSWYRHDGHPVLLLRFQADRSNPTFRLQQLKVGPGTILVSARSNDGAVHENATTASEPPPKPAG
jgi:hypothetical protein